MPYHQSWETGHARITELRHAAARERSYREAIGGETGARAIVATFARRVADRLSRFADRLETRPARFVTSRPDRA